MGLATISSFVFWFGGSALVYGVHAIEQDGGVPKPLTWLGQAFRRTPAVLGTFVLPIIPASVLLAPALYTIYEMYRIISNIRLTVPTDAQLSALGYEELGGSLLVGAAVPLAFLVSAPIMQNGMGLFAAVWLVLRTCFTRANLGRFIVFSIALIGIFAVMVVIGAALGELFALLPALAPLWILMIDLIGLIFTAYAAVVAGLVWSRGYFSPRSP
ncbi:MAG: hypothetical protein JOY86_05180 [Candidatus Eremiobacteraeota bacterium]|nr:hypothetical protein [Candidatus Eremiobacteraeota bacterium]